MSIRGLFSEYLPRREQEPMRVTDPRQQTMLTNQMLTPVMNKPVMPSREVPVFPSIGGIGGGFIPTQPPSAPVSNQTLTPVMPKPTPPTRDVPLFPSVGGIGGGVVPTEEEEKTTDPFASSFERTPFDLMADAEEGSRVQADPVDTVYEGDNRPTYIKEVVGLDADTYNQFLSEFYVSSMSFEHFTLYYSTELSFYSITEFTLFFS